MFIEWSKVAIIIRPGTTDMRKHINGLSAIAQSELDKNVFNGQLFMFCSKTRRQLKILYWDRNGFCLWCKRLEKDKFPWPDESASGWTISTEQLRMLLDGVDFFHTHQRLNYSHVM